MTYEIRSAATHTTNLNVTTEENDVNQNIEDLRNQTARAVAEMARRNQETAGRSDEPPRLGDVYLSNSGKPHVEWIVLKNRVDRALLQAVPLDDCPLVGSNDIELDNRALGAAAVARCGITASVRPSKLKTTMRTGRVNRFLLGRIRRKRRAIVKKKDHCDESVTLVDTDPEYQEWLNEVRQTRDELSDGCTEENTSVDLSEEACLVGADHRFIGPLLYGEAVQLNERYRLASYLRSPADVILILLSFVLANAAVSTAKVTFGMSTSVLDLFFTRLFAIQDWLASLGAVSPQLTAVVALQLMTLACLRSYRKPWRWVNAMDLMKLGLLVPVTLLGDLLLKTTTFAIDVPLLPVAALISYAMLAMIRLGRRTTYLKDDLVKDWRERATRASHNEEKAEELVIFTKQHERRVDLDLVDVFEAQPDKSICHIQIAQDTYMLRGSFSDFTKALDPNQFVIAAEAALNTAYFKQLRSDKQGIQGMDGRLFPTSKEKFQEIAQELREYGMGVA